MPRPSRRSTSPQKTTNRGDGWNALAALVILHAVRDVVSSPSTKWRMDARAFLESSACDALLDHLGMPSNGALLAKIDGGIDVDFLKRIGNYTSEDDLVKRRENQRKRRVSQKAKKAARTLLSGAVNLVLC